MLVAANQSNQGNAQTAAMAPTPLKKNNEAYLMIFDMLKVFVSKWYWFLLCITICLFAAWAYLLITPPMYTREASILIKNEAKGSSTMENMAFIDANVDVNNELFTLKSPSIASAATRVLHLDVSYYCQGRFHKEAIYGSALNVKVSFLDLNDNDAAEFMMELKEDNTFVIRDFVRNGDALDSRALASSVGKTIKTPLGKIKVEKSGAGFSQNIDLCVQKIPFQDAVNEVTSNLDVSAASEMSTIITLTYQDVSVQRAEDVLSTIISVYNENWVKDRNRMTVSTSEFIEDRLKIIEDELGNVEDNISSFKSANLIPATTNDVASIYVNQASDATVKSTELNNQLYMARYVRNYLANTSNRFQLIPANQGADAGLSSQISEYNSLLLTRNNLLNASSLQNPLVQDYDVQLEALRNSLIMSIDNRITELSTALRSTQSVHHAANRKIASSPQQAKFLLSVERQQKVKENLYLFLLQKREENELSQAFTAYNSRLITPASGSNDPTFPRRPIVWALGLLAGFAIPAVLIFLIEAVNNKVRGRRDLDDVSIPFLGEIPMHRHKRSLKEKIVQRSKSFWENIVMFRIMGKKPKEDKTLHILVKERSRNVVNEAFRVVRTNIEFMTANEEIGKVIMLSSFNPNSGKTFVASNLITSFAIKHKRVVAIDLDLRKASLSAMVGSPSIGVADYLSGMVKDLDKVMVRNSTHEGLDVLPVGTIPPNPTELLFEPKLKELIDSLRKEYDYIFIDCPPVEIVADATIIGQHADMTLFVVRAEVLDRSLLPEIQKYYDNNRLPKMSLILNGTTDAFSYYGYHRYGTRYGYYGASSYGGYTHDS